MSAIYRDFRYAVRLLGRNPMFTLVASLSLALGIGANSALFNMFNSLLWQPLPVDAPEQVIRIYSRSAKAPFSDDFPWPEYLDYAADTSFDGLAAFTIAECAVAAPGQDAMRIYGEAVSGNFFAVLRPQMRLGRGFHPDEGQAVGRDPIVVLGHSFWQRRFAGDPAIVGRTVTLNNLPFTVVGVTAPEFKGVFAIYFAADFWVPATMLPQLSPQYPQILESRDNRDFRLIGRLKPGMTIEQAGAAVSTVAARLEAEYPKTNKGIRAKVYRDVDTRPEVDIAAASNGVAFLFLGVAGLVLLVACANVANLLLARSSARRKEIAMRVALGASRLQIVRQLLVEAVLLSLLAAVLGMALGLLASNLIASFQVPTDLPIVFDFRVDLRVVAFTIATSLLAAVAFGLVPALRASRGDLVPALKSGPAQGAAGRRFALANGLVVVQVAASLVLLIVAGLSLRSIGGARTIDPGFRTEHRVRLSFNPSLVGYDDARTVDFYRVLIQRVRELPSIEAASLVRSIPLDFEGSGGDVVVEGRPPSDDRLQVGASTVDEEYFRTLGTPIVRGRAFTANDTASSPPVVIVNETMARRLWPGRDPIGRRVQYDIPDGPFLEIVGVAADGKYRQLTESPMSYMFLPLSQRPRPRLALVASYRGDFGSTLNALRSTVKSIDPAMPIFETKTMDQHMERAMMAPRLSAALAGPAGLLAAVAGLASYVPARRALKIDPLAALRQD